jgi:hypothetical protein
MTLTDRLKSGIEEFVKRLTARYDYAGVHGYTVVAQNADFTLELKPDDPKIDPPLPKVPIKYDSPSNRVTVKAGATCNVMYTNKDPTRPFAFGFDPGEYELIEIGTDGQKIAQQGGLVLSGGKTAMVSFFSIEGLPLSLVQTPTQGAATVSIPGPFFVRFGSTVVPPSAIDPSGETGSTRLAGFIASGAKRGMVK